MGRRFLGSEGFFISKNLAKELISVASLLVLLPKVLLWMVSEKSGNFLYSMSGNPFRKIIGVELIRSIEKQKSKLLLCSDLSSGNMNNSPPNPLDQ